MTTLAARASSRDVRPGGADGRQCRQVRWRVAGRGDSTVIAHLSCGAAPGLAGAARLAPSGAWARVCPPAPALLRRAFVRRAQRRRRSSLAHLWREGVAAIGMDGGCAPVCSAGVSVRRGATDLAEAALRGPVAVRRAKALREAALRPLREVSGATTQREVACTFRWACPRAQRPRGRALRVALSRSAAQRH